MLYKFKSPAAGDVIMLGPQGDQVLRLMGREPAAKGIFEATDLPGLLAALQAAVDAEAAMDDRAEGDEPGKPAVSMRQRLWPLIDMLRRCHAAGESIVWGV